MRKKVLVVDDSPTIRQQVRVALAAGFLVEEAVDGLEGAALIREMTNLSLVLCDVNMPRMNGLELVESIKSDPQYAALPIVMLTTESQPGLIQRAKAAGATGWIIKPFKPDLLVATVRKLSGA